MMSPTILFFGAAMFGAVVNAQCDAVSDVVQAMQMEAKAPMFCTSLLRISTAIAVSTVTVTSTVRSVAPTVTVSLTSFSTKPVEVKATVTVTNPKTKTSKEIVYETEYLCEGNSKRDLQKRATATPLYPPAPGGLKYFPLTKLSSGCSCLSLPTPTKTKTQTQTALATSMLAGKTVTKTFKETITFTKSTFKTITTMPVTTTTTTITATTTIEQCLATCEPPTPDQCGLDCVDFLTDNDNCGKCDEICEVTEFCDNGTCVDIMPK